MKLSTKNITLGYDNTKIIKNIDLSIPEGQITALVGANGCGKSTLLRGFNCSLKIWEILEIWARFTCKIYDVLTPSRPNFHPNELIWTPKS